MSVIDQLQKTKEPHPLDVKYDLLQCRLSVVDKKSDDYKVTVNDILYFSAFSVVTLFDCIKCSCGVSGILYQLNSILY